MNYRDQGAKIKFRHFKGFNVPWEPYNVVSYGFITNKAN